MKRALLLVLLLGVSAAAQQPRIGNGRIETRSAASGLPAVFQALAGAQNAPAWIGYAVPILPGDRQMCCFSSQACCGGCALEASRGLVAQSTPPGPVRLEGPTHLVVLIRVESQRVGKIRHFSPDCELDAGGLPVYWLTEVRPAESVALLASLASGRLVQPALGALALHADAAADTTLEQLTAASQPESLREHAAFWLGSARGRRGYEALRRLIREDPSDRLREKAAFALSVSKEPEALETLIAAARTDKSPRVRSQALFWLAQKAGKKAAETITDAIAADPETEVKKKAVFALSRLPNEESVRLLIEVARTNRNPVVRKEAIVWLGRSRDPRALDYLESILTR